MSITNAISSSFRFNVKTGRCLRFLSFMGLPNYVVSDDGLLWSRHVAGSVNRIGKWRKIKRCYSKSIGYYVVNLKGKTHLIHRLVLLAFVGPCPEGMEGCHFDGNRLNNNLTNLRWDTRKANCADTAKHGRMLIGENAPRAKLTNDTVVEIRRLYATGNYTMQSLSVWSGVNLSSIHNIIHRKRWRHI